MNIKTLAVIVAVSLSTSSALAKDQILVNSDVTTHIVMPENIKMVDISTSKIAGNQCTDNIVRIKPYIEGQDEPNPDDRPAFIPFCERELLGTLTLIGERHIAQYEIVYTSVPESAASIFHVPYIQMESYVNPDVSMPESEMARYAWAVYGSNRKYNQIVSKKHGIKAVINNIYSVGDYFFIDYSLENKTKIPYTIDELRIKLVDRKEVKATNSQSVELTPAFSLNLSKKFSKNYRNVLVIPKLTFPDEKVLNIAISEDQISGRVISLTMHYEDILNADGFSADILNNIPVHSNNHIFTSK